MSEKKKGLFGRMFSTNGTSDEPSPEEVQRWLGQTGRRPGYGPGPGASQPGSQQPTAFQGGSPTSPGASGAQRRAFSDLASGFAGGSSTQFPPDWKPPGYRDDDDDDESLGVEIANVGPSGPLADAGLREGDIIVAVDGNAVGDEADLAEALGSLAPGRSAVLEIVRGNSRITATVVAPG